MLAIASTAYHDELVADFQQTYGMDVWATDWGGLDDGEAAHLGALAYQLPSDSRVRRAIAPAASHSTETQILRQIELNQRGYMWAQADKSKRGAEPQPILLDGEQEAHERAVAEQERNAVDVADALGLSI